MHIESYKSSEKKKKKKIIDDIHKLALHYQVLSWVFSGVINVRS